MATLQESNKFHKKAFESTSKIRQEKVMQAAHEAFAAKGYSGTSINDIAKKAEISIGAMYSYFASKEDLFLSIVNHAYETMDDILKKIANESSDLMDCIERMLVTSRTFAQDYPELNQMYLDITTQALSGLSERLSDRLENITPQLLQRKIKEAKAQGVVAQTVDEKVISFCLDNLFMMYQFSFSSDYYKQRMKIYVGQDYIAEPEKMEKHILKFIEKGLLGIPSNSDDV